MSKFTSKFASVGLTAITVVSLSGFAIAPAVAQTSTDIQAQITSLLAQIATLQSQLSSGTSGANACTFTRSLTVGSQGTDVTCLQTYLKSLAYANYPSTVAATGYFGTITRAAVSAWQAANGVSPTAGYFGPISRAKYVSMGGSVVTPPTTPPTTPVGVAGTVSLLGPASSTVITTQSQATLANFAVNGTGTITGVSLKRTGVSADASLSNVYLYDGNTRLTDGASVSSGSVVNFTGLNIPVTGSRTISVKADMAANAGETVGVQLTSITMTGTTFTGLPVSGNLHNTAVATLAQVTFSNATATGNTDPGVGLNVWEGTATVATRNVTFTRLALRQIGSINNADINNFKLMVDGVEVASQMNIDSNGYVTFSGFSKTLLTGARTLKVTADVIGGSGRTVQMSLRGSYDVDFVDTQYGASRASAGTFPFGAAAFTVNNGTMTVVKATGSAAQNVTRGGTDVSLATYTFTAYGERIKVETLRVGVITTGGTVTEHTLQNVRLMVSNAQVGSTTNVPAAASFAAASGTSFTTNFYVTPGTPVAVEIRGDVVDSEDTDNIAAGTVTAIQTLLVGGTATSNAVPQVSLGTINVPSQTNVLGNTLTVAVGSLTLSQQSNYSGQTIVVPQTNFKLGSFNLVGNSTEAVNINTFEIDFTGVGTFDASDDLTDVYLKYSGQNTTVKGTVTDSDNSWSVSFQLAANQTIPVEVYATVGSTITAADTIRVDLTATGVTTSSSTTVYADVTSTNSVKDAGFQGQVITAGAGSITVSVDASRPNAALLDDSGTVTTAAFKFDAVNGSYTITDVVLTLADASAVQNVMLMDGATTIATKPAGTTININGVSIAVAANTSKVLTVQLQMGTIGVGAGLTGASVLTTLTSATARDSQGASAAVTESPANPAGQAMYAYKAYPTITNVALPSTALTIGTKTLAKFTVSSGATGTVGWGKLAFVITKNVAGTDTLATATLEDVTSGSAANVAGTALFTGGIEADNGTTGGITFIPNTEQQVSGSKTYELRVVVAGAPVAGNSITTQIAQPSSFVASVAAFALHSASSITYYDTDAGATVTAGDVRQTASQLNHSSAYAQVNGGVVTFLTSDTTDENRSFGTFTTGATIILTETGAATNTIGALTGTLVSTDLFTCTARDAANGGGAATTSTAAILSVLCTNGAGNQVVLNTAYPGANVAAESTTITLTVGTAFAVGSTVASTDSDLGLVVAGGVAPAASFVWSDVSKASHSFLTTDWTNGYLIKNLATDTQNLTL